jgi:hypothetical protein
MYFAGVHNFTNFIEKVAKCDGKQWTLPLCKIGWVTWLRLWAFANMHINFMAFSPQVNYTDRATADCGQSYDNFIFWWIESVAWSAQRIPPAVNSVFLTGAATFSFR